MLTESTFISIREAARRLGVHDNTVRRYADRGLIGATRLPSGVRRVRRQDVEALAPAEAPGTARSIEDLVAGDIWRSDDELEKFLTLTYAERDRDR